MDKITRRQLLEKSALGLAAASVGALALRADAKPTETSGPDHNDSHIHSGYGAGSKIEVHEENPVGPHLPDNLTLTEDNILGPYYRPGTPYRGKVTAPGESGQLLLIGGRVWGYDTKKPLPGAMLEIWQANTAGRYDNDDPNNPPNPGVYKNRIRLHTDETGFYEYESIHPGRYKTSPDTWRPSHVHYMVHAPGYKSLVTQLYFKGDPYNDTDLYIKKSLIIEVVGKQFGGDYYETGTFDIVLAPLGKSVS